MHFPLLGAVIAMSRTKPSDDSRYVKMSDKGRVTVPEKFRRILGLETGDTVMFRLTGQRLELIPTSVVPRDQVWYYAASVQRRVAEAEGEIAAGETTKVEGTAALGEFLDRLGS